MSFESVREPSIQDSAEMFSLQKDLNTIPRTSNSTTGNEPNWRGKEGVTCHRAKFRVSWSKYPQEHLNGKAVKDKSDSVDKFDEQDTV